MPMVSRAAALALLALGCGSDPAAPRPPPSSSKSTLEEVQSSCDAFAERLCASAQPCCEQSGAFDQQDCVDSFVQSVCTPTAQLAAAGIVSYDASSEDSCLAAHQRAHDVCMADWQELMAIRRDEETSCKVVIGSVAEGQHCETDGQCAPPDADGSSLCAQGVCRVVRFLGEGAACPFPLGDVSTCDTGLFCTAEAQGDTGVCQPVTPEGEPCEKIFLNPACGLGSYCDQDDGICKKATNFGGPSCTQDNECVSFVCDRVTHVCRDA
ncbi:MAG TPA: hypothetical protein VGQ57_02355, partial [Polyangiaceae bacterium]|nr:hypothetical protein [Polyangiaceae bacterium]